MNQLIQNVVRVWVMVFITAAVGSTPAQGEESHHYVIKFISDLRQVHGFLWVLQFPSFNKTDSHDIAEILKH